MVRLGTGHGTGRTSKTPNVYAAWDGGTGPDPWKAPLPSFIEHLYHKRFGKTRPDVILSIEDLANRATAKKAARNEAKCSLEGNKMENVKIGVAWYLPEQWDRLREISDDRENLEKTYQEWLAVAENTCAMLAKEGVQAEKVIVDIAELEAWCRSKGKPITAEARSQFVSDYLRLRNGGGEQN